MSEEFAASGAASGKDRTLLASSGALFVWASLAETYGIPGIPEWAEWFLGQLEKHKALVPVLGIGCSPTLVKGNKEQFPALVAACGTAPFAVPRIAGPIHWPSLDLRQTFLPTEP